MVVCAIQCYPLAAVVRVPLRGIKSTFKSFGNRGRSISPSQKIFTPPLRMLRKIHYVGQQPNVADDTIRIYRTVEVISGQTGSFDVTILPPVPSLTSQSSKYAFTRRGATRAKRATRLATKITLATRSRIKLSIGIGESTSSN